MPNAPGPAAAEGLQKITSSSPLLKMFDRHAHAYAVDSAAWAAVGDFEDAPQIRAMPEARVQCGQTLLGRDSEGKEIWQPSYCYSVESITKHVAGHRDTHLSLLSGERNKANREKVEAQFEQILKEKLDAFAAVEAERKLIEDECGYSQAMEAARGTSKAVKEIERAIIDYLPRSLDEAAQKAAWVVSVFNSCGGYIEDEKQLVETLSSIAKAFGSEERE
ncbi:hypothetical protein [Sinorhizobium sp. BJ1]|uniref:hypothetical protein n=1 Tax=Sinorhizobium sp. BJ1 TaxID=2035455 RepID=UPI000BEA6D73|nr:hypothetical protein [Sinorhizobium sp. BJ1]PDT82911.1 hypothetical protein CO676_15160 [Sinorhizobium sp. BJ1]